MIFVAAAAALLAAVPPGCRRDEARAEPPPTVDVAALPTDQVVGRVLEHCHGRIVGMDRFAARVALPDGTELTVYGHLPERLRAQWPDGATWMLDGERAFRFVAGTEVLQALDAAATARMLALRTLLDAAALGPLHRAIGCERIGPLTFRLAQPATMPTELELQPGTLLPAALRSQAGDVTIREHLHTSASHVVQRAEIAPLGNCAVRFDSVDVVWDESMFARIAAVTPATSEPAPTPTAEITVGVVPQPIKPEFEAVRAARWLVVDDPGDWQSRAAVVQKHMATLTARGQVTAGFAGLLQEGDRARLAIPFRAAPNQADYSPAAGEDLREVPAGRALVVFPPSGDFAQRRQEGERLLQQALEQRGLRAAMPILVQPYLHLDEATPDAAALAAPTVRCSVVLR